MLRDVADLVRAPAALSVPGDAIAGAAAARCLSPRTAGLAAASVCLYYAGMAANDWADRELDAVQRPERPIPSGRVTAGQALAVSSGLTAAGLAVAGMSGGRRAVRVAVPLAAAVWLYDLALKNTRYGPAGMALCRGLDVLLGASPGKVRRAAVPAAVVAAHTYVVTELSRHEVVGAPAGLPQATLAATACIAVAATGASAASVALSGSYAAGFGAAQRKVLQSPEPRKVRAAVGAGLMAFPALQGALAAARGFPLVGISITVLAALGKRLARPAT